MRARQTCHLLKMTNTKAPAAVDFMAQCHDRLQNFIDRQDVLGLAPWNVSPALQAFREPLNYSLKNGGKRIRPVLVYAAAQALQQKLEDIRALDYAALAVELVHTYSLIHDDLPAMDDDSLRRGRPTLHKAYDEATAILAGDALQAHAFELLADTPDVDSSRKIMMLKTLSAAAGPMGMVGGQFIDIQSTGLSVSLESLQTMHALKTGALIRASLNLGGIAAGGSAAELDALDNYGRQIGLAFQVVDDILDVESSTATLGKTQGKDVQDNKPTYVTLMGIENARQEADRLLQGALDSLDALQSDAYTLRALGRYIVARDR